MKNQFLLFCFLGMMLDGFAQKGQYENYITDFEIDTYFLHYEKADAIDSIVQFSMTSSPTSKQNELFLINLNSVYKFQNSTYLNYTIDTIQVFLFDTITKSRFDMNRFEKLDSVYQQDCKSIKHYLNNENVKLTNFITLEDFISDYNTSAEYSWSGGNYSNGNIIISFSLPEMNLQHKVIGVELKYYGLDAIVSYADGYLKKEVVTISDKDKKRFYRKNARKNWPLLFYVFFK